MKQKKFLEYFQISKEDFFDWGIKATIFPPLERVQKEWGELKFRIFNDKPVYIRGYGRDAHGTQLYLDLYKYLFNNKSILKDPSNNTAPTRLIEKSTGLKKNKTIIIGKSGMGKSDMALDLALKKKGTIIICNGCVDKSYYEENFPKLKDFEKKENWFFRLFLC